MPGGRKVLVDKCKLHIKVCKGNNIPDRMFGAKPSSFVTCYWDSVCGIGEQPPASNSEEIEQKGGILFHTPVISKDIDPEWNYTKYLLITPQNLQNNEKIRFLVRHKSIGGAKVLAQGAVAIGTIFSLIHDECNIQTTEDGDTTQPLIVNLPLTTFKPSERPTTLVVQFTLKTIPNQALYVLRRFSYSHGFHCRTLQNFIRVALLYQSRDAFRTILNLAATFYDNKNDQTYLEFLQSRDKLVKSLKHCSRFTSDMYRDVGDQKNVNFIIFEFIQWYYGITGESVDALNFEGTTLAGYSVVEDNSQMLEWLLQRGVDASETHFHDYREFFLDELCEYVSEPQQRNSCCLVLQNYFTKNPSAIIALETRHARNIRQRKFDLIRQCFFMQKADSYIEKLAEHTVQLELDLSNLLSSFQQALQNRNLNEISSLVNRWDEIIEREFELENIFHYCDFLSQQIKLSELSQYVMDRADALHKNDVIIYSLRLIFSYLYYYNQPIESLKISPTQNSPKQMLELGREYPDIFFLCCQATAASIDYQTISDTSYRSLFIYLSSIFIELAEKKPLEISPTSTLYGILVVFEALTRNPRGFIIVKLLDHSTLIQKFIQVISHSEYFEKASKEEYILFCGKILEVVGNFAREVTTANYLVAQVIILPVFEFVCKHRDSAVIYQHGIILLNRLFVEEKSRHIAHQRGGWDVLDPSKIQGGSYFLAKHMVQVKELMWHGLQHFCYIQPSASTSACFMVWRLLYYRCIPEEQISAFIDRFSSKFRSLWESTDNLVLKTSILQVLRQILAINTMNNKRNLIHITIEHDFLSYSYKCIKQYGTANKPKLVQVAIEFLAAISLDPTINYQLTQDPDWIIAEHIMVCLKHPDLRGNYQVQNSGCYLIGRLVSSKQVNKFIDLLNEYGIVMHVFKRIFPRCNDAQFRAPCKTAAAMLLMMISCVSIHSTFMRLHGIEKMVELAQLMMDEDEGIVKYALEIINTCCKHSGNARQIAMRLDLPKLISIACIKHSQLQSDKSLQNFMLALSKSS